MTESTRGPQAKPTKADINAAWSRLKQSSETGCPLSNALLIALSSNRPLFHTNSGIVSILGTGGWAGDENDPRDSILAAIRENDPSSKQLPENNAK